MEGIFSMPFAEYKKAPGVNISLLKIMGEESPAHVKAELDGIRQKSESRDLRFGSVFHSWVLEPETIESTFHYRPDVYGDENKPWNGNAKECKNWITAHSDMPIVARDDVKSIKAMSESLRASKPFMDLFAGGQSEQSLFAVDREGTQLKARLDRLSVAGNVVLDLKTCQSAKPEEFEKTVLDFNYHQQAAFYLDICNLLGLQKKVFVFAAIEKKPPYVCSMLRLTDEVIRHGRAQYKRSLATYRQCAETNSWPGYVTGVQTIELPQWAMKQLGN